MKAKCPRCKKEAKDFDEVMIYFGIRRLTKKKYYPQSYCKVCRGNNTKRLEVYY